MKGIYTLSVMVFMVSLSTYGQCPLPNPVSNSGCSGSTEPISAQSLSSDNVSEHRWYTVSSGGTQISGVSQNTAPGSGYYISTLTQTFNATTTYYVAPVCNFVESSQRVAVTFTVITAASISIQVGPSALPEYCPGDTISLTAQNGSGYKWRLNSPTASILSTATIIYPTTSGTYYLTGTNSCGSEQTTSIVITFAEPSTPTTLTPIQGCGNTTLRRGTPPSDETWYWQSTSTGTSTLDSSDTKVVSSGTVYYLRAKAQYGDCWGPAKVINYTIDPNPGEATGADVSRCGTGTVTLTAALGSNADQIRWYSATSGGTLLYTGTSYTTPSLSTTTSYYAESYNSVSGCSATTRKQIQAIIGAVPLPTAVPNSGCAGDTEPISARSPDSDNITEHRWYTAASGGSPIGGVTQNTAPGSGNYISTLTQTFNATTTYYVAAVCGTTESTQRVAVTYTVLSAPSISILVGPGVQQKYCPGDTISLTAQNGSGYEWRLNSSTAAVFSTATIINPTASGTYYLTGIRSCGSAQTTSIDITFAEPGTPTALSSIPGCGDATLQRDTPPSDEIWYWQTTATGTDTTDFSETKVVSGETVYLRAKAQYGDCWGPAIEVLYTVNPNPGEATGADVSRCGAGTVTLTAALGSNADQIRWYDVASGGIPLDTGTSYITPSIGITTSYYAESYNTVTLCIATTRKQIQAIITSGFTWYLDADGDGFAISTTVACTSPGAGYTQTVLTLDDLDDSTENITNIPPQNFYADFDADGFGDPNDSLYYSVQPANYVTDNTDLCPSEYGLYNGCIGIGGNENYIYTRSYQRGITLSDSIQENDIIESISYFDGLGRPMQQITIKAAPDKYDIITHIGYDQFGRQDKDWLPYYEPNGTVGTYRGDVATATQQYYQTNYSDDFTGIPLTADINAYSQKELEASPLNRVHKQAAPGEDWKLAQGAEDHSIEFDYLANIATEVRLFSVNLTTDYIPSLVEGGYYTAGELNKIVTKDENHPGTTTKDHTTEEFGDKQGRVVLKRTYENEVAHDIYYVYDDYGNLAYVLPPKMEGSTETLANILTNMSSLGYQYIYDHRSRLVEKQIPGKGKEYIVYNNLDQPIMTQDANQGLKTPKEWLFTKYDAFGRVAYTGRATDDRSRTDIQNEVNALIVPLSVNQSGTFTNFGGADVYYDDGAYPSNLNSTGALLTEVLTINYYDSYIDLPVGAPTSVSPFSVNNDPNVKGLATGSKIKVLDVSGPDVWISTVSYYDSKGRAIYAYSDNSYLATVDIVEFLLDFVGRPLKTRTSHIRNNSTIVTLDNFSYDHMGRLLAQTQCIGDETMGDYCTDSSGTVESLTLNGTIDTDTVATKSIVLEPVTTITPTGSQSITLKIDPTAEVIAINTYDELGQLVKKEVGNLEGSSRLQTIDYTYNVRGWLKQINDPASLGNDLFTFGINYNTVAHGGTPLFNGNIAETEWLTKNDSILRWYKYGYDALNRITNGTDNTTDQRYSLQNIGYDKNGNIENLLRKGHIVADPDANTASHFGIMDSLSYTYDSGNRLLKVADAAAIDGFGFKDDAVNTTADTTDDYTYDVNGNMTANTNKGITGITYNHLNLPTQVTITGGNISYIYDATGVKQRKVVTEGGSLNTTSYAGNFIYEKIGSGSDILQFFNHPEGYIEPDGTGGYDYVYNYTDHLDNVRLSYSDLNGDGSIDPSTEILKEKNYYPFGLSHKGYNNVINSTYHPYGFGGKEENDELGLKWLDFSARNYDAAIGRWMNLDPLAEQMRRHSPYNFAFDNPIYFIDPDGMMPDSGIDPIKKVTSSQKIGNTNPTQIRVHRYKRKSNGPLDFRTRGAVDTHLLPTSGKSGIGVSVEHSTMVKELSGLGNFFTEQSVPSTPVSVSSELTTTTSQFFDSEGNMVDTIDNASSFKVTSNTETTTVDINNFGEISDQATVTNSSTTTSYDVSSGSGLKDFGGKQLTNGKTITSKPTISTINFENTGSTLQNNAKSAAGARFEADALGSFGILKNAGEIINAPIEERLKQQSQGN